MGCSNVEPHEGQTRGRDSSPVDGAADSWDREMADGLAVARNLLENASRWLLCQIVDGWAELRINERGEGEVGADNELVPTTVEC